MEEYLSAVANFGFPVVVSAYLLFRFETRVKSLEESMIGRNGLLDKIDDLSGKIDMLGKIIRDVKNEYK
jgi:hypothetical protein